MSVTALKQNASEPKKISAGGVKKTKNIGLKTITANDLMTGEVIYFTSEGTWSMNLINAAVAEGERAMALLDKALADEARAVGPYLMDVDPGAEGPRPAGRATLRETIRRAGPTIHPEFGKVY